MLFRAQALSHAQQDQAEGRILVRSPRMLWVCSIASLIAAAAIALLLFAASYTPHMRLSGHLSSGTAGQLLVPASALPHLHSGQRLALHLPALGRDGVAIVDSVSRVSDSAPARYRVLFTPDQQEGLRAGMELEAAIALPPSRLITWIVK